MRKKQIHKKFYKPDIEFDNIAISRFINYVMHDGKKSTAERLVYSALEKIKKEQSLDPKDVFEKALENASAKIIVRMIKKKLFK